MNIYKVLFAYLALTIFTPLIYSEEIGSRPFIVFSTPKSGTHLLSKILSSISGKESLNRLSPFRDTAEQLEVVKEAESENQFLVVHYFKAEVLQELSAKGYRIIFLVRDPRDQLISAIDWIEEGHWKSLPGLNNLDEYIDELITGKKHHWKCFEECYLKLERETLGLPLESIYRSEYEKLVGPNGGGSLDSQLKEIGNIANFIGFALNDEQIRKIARDSYGGTHTFRHGKIGRWKESFTANHKENYKRLYQKELVRLGYETNDAW